MNKYQKALDEMCCGCYASCSKDGKPCLAYMKLQELVDKSKPKEAIRKKFEDSTKTRKHSLVDLVGYYYICPNCESYLGAFIDDYCKYCGQALVRSKEDE